MKNLIFLILVLAFSQSMVFAQKKILIITGGHDYEKKPFYDLFNSYSDVHYDTLVQPAGNELIQSGGADQYDALVFYDMFQEITESQKSAYLQLLDQGQGMVFLHHSLVSYQDWPEFQSIIGGKYLLDAINEHPPSTYKHDVDINVNIVDDTHFITRGMEDFQIRDEVYGDYLVNKTVTPLLITNHPESTETIGWCHTYGKSRIVYLQSGHDHHGYENEHFKTLVYNAIQWVISEN